MPEFDPYQTIDPYGEIADGDLSEFAIEALKLMEEGRHCIAGGVDFTADGTSGSSNRHEWLRFNGNYPDAYVGPNVFHRPDGTITVATDARAYGFWVRKASV